LQSRLRLWRLRRLWLRRVRPGLVGCLRYRVCSRYMCSLLHILGRLPLLLRPAPHSALSRQRRLHAVIPHPLNRHYERIDSGPACGASLYRMVSATTETDEAHPQSHRNAHPISLLERLYRLELVSAGILWRGG
jgi:hypothetical protein